MSDLGQTRPNPIGRLLETRWFPIAVTFLAIISVGAEVCAILRGVADLVGH